MTRKKEAGVGAKFTSWRIETKCRFELTGTIITAQSEGPDGDMQIDTTYELTNAEVTFTLDTLHPAAAPVYRVNFEGYRLNKFGRRTRKQKEYIGNVVHRLYDEERKEAIFEDQRAPIEQALIAAVKAVVESPQ